MRIKELEMRPLDIAFRAAFAHASAQRDRTASVLVMAQTTQGSRGVGEGCPRDYVTGETTQTALAFFKQIRKSVMTLTDMAGLRRFVEIHEQAINRHPAAWCAIETAIIDCMAREQGVTVESLLGVADCAGKFHYSGILGVAQLDTFRSQLQQYQTLGMRDFKVKLSGLAHEDQARLAILSDEPEIRVRLDANNLWQDSKQALRYLQALPAVFWAIEEPLAVGDLAGCQVIADGLGTQIVADESFLRKDQLPLFRARPDVWILNVRVSKMGGLLRSLNVMQQGIEQGMRFIVGAQVGETSILTRLAVSVANTYTSHVVAQEGAFGTYLLARDLTSKPLMFGREGVLELDYSRACGLGIDYDLL